MLVIPNSDWGSSKKYNDCEAVTSCFRLRGNDTIVYARKNPLPGENQSRILWAQILYFWGKSPDGFNISIMHINKIREPAASCGRKNAT